MSRRSPKHSSITHTDRKPMRGRSRVSGGDKINTDSSPPPALGRRKQNGAIHKPIRALRIVDTNTSERSHDETRVSIWSVQPAFVEFPTIRRGSKAAARRYKGPVKRANLLTPNALKLCAEWIATKSRSPQSDQLKLLLAVRAGLRASEISDLPIDAMLDARGRIQDEIEIYARKTKTRRTLPMHPEIRDALEALLIRFPQATHAAFSIGRYGHLRHQSASCVANWFHRMFRSAGLKGCSSHSGRRTFATEFGRLLGGYQGSTKDLQMALGHACLSSTECYLEPSDRIADLIRSLGS